MGELKMQKESLPIQTTACRLVGKSSGLGPGERRFETCHADQHRSVAQSVERAIDNRKVAGSIPATSTSWRVAKR
ncbi:hypothetical protein [Roseovarius sp. 217 phage 1]|uniref:Uncharacterized protein n=1 Tax=Roseovarius sp. 217 phage 1 TaxID=874471 RepID=E3PZC7_9CAUD|nr:hypothetical protein [Roseovarius sp. 217 phage 1]